VDAPVRIRQAGTSVGQVRYAAVPVSVAGGTDRGYYVVATVLRPQRQVIAQGAVQYALVALGCLGLVGLGGWLVAGRLLRPLRLLREAAEHISHTDLSLRIPAGGHDDVSELTRTVNAMLDRLQAGFEAQQRFLDDAGHELRTPVTIVAGHLEVLDPHDPSEVAEVRDLALDELERMSRLITDLTLLAKSRRPDFVHPAPVDLTQLIDDVLGKAVALGRRRWRLDSRATVVIDADAQRLTQALLQLADNAVRHTTEGEEIALGSAVEHDQVRLWVRDTGPGIAAEDQERIFERFTRASNVPGRTGEGSGLGLAIVTAIAQAHGGRAVLHSIPGQGATFSLLLPARTALGRIGFGPTGVERPGTERPGTDRRVEEHQA
jgi:signal transduction histidine kinase